MTFSSPRWLVGALAGIGTVLSLALVASLLHLSPSDLRRAAADICFIGADGSQKCDTDQPPTTPPPTYAPAELVNPGALPADPAAAAAVRALEAQAVDVTLEQHALPASDRDAVQTWGRSEALANLWILVTAALSTPAADRTADEQHVADWIGSMVDAQQTYVARSIGEQYVAYAGLNTSTYAQLFESGTKQQVESYFSPEPQAESNGAGYCHYRSPAPYGAEYQGYQAQMCFTPCTAFNCSPPRPTYDQFARWGTAVATAHLDDPALMTVVDDTAHAIGMSALAVGVYGTAFFGMGMALYTSQVIWGFSLAGTFLATAVAPAAIALAAIVTGVFVIMDLAESLTTPGKLASLVVGARAGFGDPGSLLQAKEGSNLLFLLFAEATGVTPRADKTCDNSLIPPHLYGSTQDQTTIRDANGHVVTISTYPCLNQPPIPAASGQDPTFEVRNVMSGSVSQRASISLKVPGASGQADEVVSVRAGGGWWVVTHADGSQERTLDLTFYGIDAKPWTAGIEHGEDGGYRFRGLTSQGAGGMAMDTCVADKTCWNGQQLTWAGNASFYSARLVAP